MAQICLFYYIIALFFIIKISFNKIYFIVKNTVKCPFARIQLAFSSNFIHKLFFNELHQVVCQGTSLRVTFTFSNIFIFQDLQLILFANNLIIFQYNENTSYYLICYNILLYSYSINFF
jgi:hypothetical protein